MGCYIRCRKPPKLVTRSLRRFGALVSPRSSLGETSTGACRLLRDDRLVGCFAIRVKKTGERSSPLRGSLKSIVGDDILGVPQKTNEHHQTNNQPVILSEVEVSPSEERGETKAPKRRRDLVTSLGGLPKECNIYCRKPPRFQTRSRIG